MKAEAIVAVDAKKVEVRQIEIGEMTPWDIKVELETSGISVGTESYVLSVHKAGGRGYIPGYAPIGRVVEVGTSAASTFKVGERVSYFAPNPPVDVGQGCGGHQSPALICVDPQKKDLLASNTYCVKVPEGLSSEHSAFGGISAVSCMGASMPQARVGDKALVIGQGLIGQFAAQHLKLRGVEVAVADLHEKRLALSRQSGADHVINSSKQDMVKATRALWSEGADIIVDTTGSYDVIEASADAIRFKGKYVLLGWCKGTGLKVERFHGRVFEVYLPWTLEGRRALSSWRLMDAGLLRIDHLITHRFSYRDAQKAYDLIYRAPEEYVGILLDWRK